MGFESSPPRHRAPAGGRRLSRADAALVKAMLAQNFRQHDIAAKFFGVNGGRVSDIATGKKFIDVPAASEADLATFLSSGQTPH